MSGGLTFDQLREANVRRCVESYHALDAWNPLEWGAATAGELGEALNLIKKLERDLPPPDDGATPFFVRENRLDAIGRELADTVIYLDLLAARLGLDLGFWTAIKFDETSEKVGSRERLASPEPKP
jgi:NTP pyrophosphatase (non-canonical NTP hydrolase)